MKLTKKITYLFGAFLLLLLGSMFIFSRTAKAQLTPGSEGVSSSWFDYNNPFEWYLKVYDRNATPTDEIFGERYTAAQTQWVLYSIPSMLLNNIIGWDINSCIININTTGDFGGCLSTIKNRAISIINPFGSVQQTPDLANKNFIQLLASNNMSGIGYFSKKISNLTLVREAKAQTSGGFGFDVGAEPVQKLWQAVRNITYGLLVIVTVVLAFMIMFRVKLSPQTVVSVQSALPKVIITIILITFSYAIAGLLIDLMYVIIGLFSIIISSSGISSYSPLELFGLLTDRNTAFGLIWGYLFWWFIAAITVVFSKSWLGGIFALIFTVGVLFACIFFSFKVIWLTIKTFINIMLLIIVGPIQILLGAIIPSMGIGPWIKSMLANLMVYPLLGGMFVLAFFFLRQALPADNPHIPEILSNGLFPFELEQFLSNDAWQPPLSFGQEGVRFLWLLASFGIFAGIPKVADIIKGMIEGKPFAYGTAIGEAVGPAKQAGGAAAAGGVGYVGDRLTRAGGIFSAGDWKTDLTKQITSSVQKTLIGR